MSVDSSLPCFGRPRLLMRESRELSENRVKGDPIGKSHHQRHRPQEQKTMFDMADAHAVDRAKWCSSEHILLKHNQTDKRYHGDNHQAGEAGLD